MKKLIRLAVIMITVSVSVHAMDKKHSYQLINTCQNIENNNKGNLDQFWSGYLLGLSKAYGRVLRESNIDNEFASLDGVQFLEEMCTKALGYRKKMNEQTGGKYNVTEFIEHLELMGYMMATAIPKKSN